MIEVRQTPTFKAWLDGLTDRQTQAKIAQRIVRLEAGLFGDVRSIEGPISELRINHGPGYRVISSSAARSW